MVIHVQALDLASPWAFVIVTVLALVDGVVPLVPARTVLVGLGVACAAGEVRAYPLVVVATAAAFVGDNISYELGAHAWSRIRPIVFRGTRAHRAWGWLEGELARHGLILVALDRVIPGGPTPITLTAGMTGLPKGRFRMAAAVSVVVWSAYALVAGAIGEKVVGDNLILALLVGVLLGLPVSLAMRIWLRRSKRPRNRAPQSAGSLPPVAQHPGRSFRKLRPAPGQRMVTKGPGPGSSGAES